MSWPSPPGSTNSRNTFVRPASPPLLLHTAHLCVRHSHRRSLPFHSLHHNFRGAWVDVRCVVRPHSELNTYACRTVVDFATTNSYTGRPQFEIGVFSVLAIFWLGAPCPFRARGGTLNCVGSVQPSMPSRPPAGTASRSTAASFLAVRPPSSAYAPSNPLADYPDTIQWCQELAALRVFVWIEWLTSASSSRPHSRIAR